MKDARSIRAARAALEHHRHIVAPTMELALAAEDRQTQLVDLLTDLWHMADEDGLDFTAAKHAAFMHFHEERDECDQTAQADGQ